MLNDTLSAMFAEKMKLEEENKDLKAKLQYLLSNFILSDEGLFCFPDGDTWNCKKID